MAEIFGLGITHCSGVVVEPEHWSKFLKVRVESGQVPEEIFRNTENWPEIMPGNGPKTTAPPPAKFIAPA